MNIQHLPADTLWFLMAGAFYHNITHMPKHALIAYLAKPRH